MSKYQIPTSCDDDWLRDMLRRMDAVLDELDRVTGTVKGQEKLDRAKEICDALQQYAGY